MVQVRFFHLRRLWTTTFEKDESASFYGIRGLISLDDDNTPFENREEGGALTFNTVGISGEVPYALQASTIPPG